ncbi:MAG: flagellin [Planctomycetes bacterium]|nr:flagellin [Planctomycetota bacterium]
MALYLSQSINSHGTLNALRQTVRRENNSLERLGSGLRINRAADDVSGMVASETLRAQSASLFRANKNIQNTINLASLAEGAMGEVADALVNLRTLVIKSKNLEDQTSSEFQSNSAEFNALLNSIDQISRTTRYGSRNIFTEYVPRTVTLTSDRGDTGIDGITTPLRSTIENGEHTITTRQQAIVSAVDDTTNNTSEDGVVINAATYLDTDTFTSAPQTVFFADTGADGTADFAGYLGADNSAYYAETVRGEASADGDDQDELLAALAGAPVAGTFHDTRAGGYVYETGNEVYSNSGALGVANFTGTTTNVTAHRIDEQSGQFVYDTDSSGAPSPTIATGSNVLSLTNRSGTETVVATLANGNIVEYNGTTGATIATYSAANLVAQGVSDNLVGLAQIAGNNFVAVESSGANTGRLVTLTLDGAGTATVTGEFVIDASASISGSSFPNTSGGAVNLDGISSISAINDTGSYTITLKNEAGIDNSVEYSYTEIATGQNGNGAGTVSHLGVNNTSFDGVQVDIANTPTNGALQSAAGAQTFIAGGGMKFDINLDGTGAQEVYVTGAAGTGAATAAAIQTAVRALGATETFTQFTATFAGGQYLFTSGSEGLESGALSSVVVTQSAAVPSQGTFTGAGAGTTAAISNARVQIDVDGAGAQEIRFSSAGGSFAVVANDLETAINAAFGAGSVTVTDAGGGVYEITSTTTGSSSSVAHTALAADSGFYTGAGVGTTAAISNARLQVNIDGAGAQEIRFSSAGGSFAVVANDLETAINAAFGAGSVNVQDAGGGVYEIVSTSTGSTSTVTHAALAADSGYFTGAGAGTTGAIANARLQVNVDGAGAQEIRFSSAGGSFAVVANDLETAINAAFGAGSVNVQDAGGGVYEIVSSTTGSTSTVTHAALAADSGFFTGAGAGTTGAVNAHFSVNINGAGAQTVTVNTAGGSFATVAAALDSAIEAQFGGGSVTVTNAGGGVYQINSSATGSTSTVTVASVAATAGDYAGGAAVATGSQIRAKFNLNVDGAGLTEVTLDTAGTDFNTIRGDLEAAIQGLGGAFAGATVSDAGGGVLQITSGTTGSSSTVAVAAGTPTGGTSVSGAGAGTTVTAGVDDQLTIDVDGLGPVQITLGTQGTGAAIAAAIEAQVLGLGGGYAGFTASWDGSQYTLTSGSTGTSSSVVVTAGTNDATAILLLGAGNGGTEDVGYDEGLAALNLAGGTATQGLDDGMGAGVFNLTGGTATQGADNASAAGILNLTGGTATQGADSGSGAGILNLTGGTATQGADSASVAGILNLTGGTKADGIDDGFDVYNFDAGTTVTTALDIDSQGTDSSFTVQIDGQLNGNVDNIVDVAYSSGTLYAINTGSNTLWSINTATGVSTAGNNLAAAALRGGAIAIAGGITGIAKDNTLGGNVLLISDGANNLHRYDVASNTILDTLQAGAGMNAITFGDGENFNGEQAFGYRASGGTITRIDLRDAGYTSGASRVTSDFGSERNVKNAAGFSFYEADGGSGSYDLRISATDATSGTRTIVATSGNFATTTMDATSASGSFRGLYANAASTTVTLINSAGVDQAGGAIAGYGARFSSTGTHFGVFSGNTANETLQIRRSSDGALVSSISNVDATKGFSFNTTDSQIAFVGGSGATIGAGALKNYDVSAGVATAPAHPNPTISGTFSPVYTQPGPASGPTIDDTNTITVETFTVVITEDHDGADKFTITGSVSGLQNNALDGNAYGFVGSEFVTEGNVVNGVTLGGGLRFTLSMDGQYVDATTGGGSASTITIDTDTQLETRLDNGPTVVFEEGDIIQLENEFGGTVVVDFANAIPSNENVVSFKVFPTKTVQMGTESHPSDAFNDLIFQPMDTDRLRLSEITLADDYDSSISGVTSDDTLISNNLVLIDGPSGVGVGGGYITADNETFTLTFNANGTYDVYGSKSRTISEGNVFSIDNTSVNLGSMTEDERKAYIESHFTENRINIRGIEFTLAGNPTAGSTFSFTFEGKGSLQRIDEAILDISGRRAAVGESINALSSLLSSQERHLDNLIKSESSIRDLDYAEESASLVRSQVLSASAQQMLQQGINMSNSIIDFMRTSMGVLG